MKIISQLGSIVSSMAIGIVLIFCMNPAHAAEPMPIDEPPEMRNLSENENVPAVTKSEKEKVKQTTQTIQSGEQTEVRVTNDVGTYVVRPNQTVGNSLPGDAQSSTNHPAQWVIKSWGGSKNTEPAETPPSLQPNSNGTDQ